jgi:hypothetical protein
LINEEDWVGCLYAAVRYAMIFLLVDDDDDDSSSQKVGLICLPDSLKDANILSNLIEIGVLTKRHLELKQASRSSLGIPNFYKFNH